MTVATSFANPKLANSQYGSACSGYVLLLRSETEHVRQDFFIGMRQLPGQGELLWPVVRFDLKAGEMFPGDARPGMLPAQRPLGNGKRPLAHLFDLTVKHLSEGQASLIP